VNRGLTPEQGAERNLEHARPYLDALINAIPTPVLVKDDSHRYIAANAAFCSFFRRPASQILGRRDPEFFSADDARYFQSTDSQALEQGTVVQYERAYPVDGTPQWMLVRKSRLIAPDGDRLVVLVLMDVTVRRATELALRHSESRFRHLTQLSADWYWEQDDQFRFSFMSSEVASKSGVRGSTSLGLTRWDHPGVDTTSADWDAHRVACLAHKEFRDFTYRRIAEDGSVRWLSVSGEPMFDDSGQFTGYRGIGKDVSKEVLAKDELRQHRDNLQRLVDERTRELLVAKEAAEAASLAKSEFLANMSHEFRTPMHAILSFARLASDRLASGSAAPEKLAQYIRRVEEGGERLLLLVNDLLDLSKLEAGMGSYEFGRHDIREIVRSTLTELEMLLKQRSLNVVCDFAAREHDVWCDAARIAQVIRNLVSNAIKFTPAGKQIAISTCESVLPAKSPHGAQGTTPCLQITVEDEGVGIPESELLSIFDKFVQSSKTRSGAGGTGLGLSITREIVSHHGGDIFAQNRAGGGAVFTCSLPKSPIVQGEEAPLEGANA